MPPSDGNADIAYRMLEQRIAAFRYRPGARLSPDNLSDDIRIGLTPTRTALQWLYRDGLIDHQPRHGFFVKTPSVEETRSLYLGNTIQLEGSIAVHRACLQNAQIEPDHVADSLLEPAPIFQREGKCCALANAAQTIFSDIAALSKSDVVIRAVKILNSRLHFIRLVEREVIGGVGEDLYKLNYLVGIKRYKSLQKAVAAYHKQRLNYVPDLVDAACARALRQEAA